ncbi:MAG TPA: carbohydrate porin [Chitinophagaceae bacterium]|nr:carbohydrate porin [Chitinophagaceae bacterium]
MTRFTLRKTNRLGLFLVLLQLIPGAFLAAQNSSDTSHPAKAWSAHFQVTVIGQSHSGFRSPYRGPNSLADTVEPVATSVSSTLYLGRKLWKGAAIYFNPEVTGGKGLSFTTGVAGALNGETYRVGATQPQVFIARAYFQQTFALGKQASNQYLPDEANQVAGRVPARRLTLTIGKFALSDFFDDNAYSRDPRTQFFNWSLWANGAWDYPANTRGYTFGLVADYTVPGWTLRFSSTAVPKIANYKLMEYQPAHAHSETLELEHQYLWNGRPGAFRLNLSRTQSRAPSYQDGLKALRDNDRFLLLVIAGDTENIRYGGKKMAIAANMDQQLTRDLGLFSRIGWNDGRYVSWAFTEIDRTFNLGLSLKGSSWHRPQDVVGLGSVINGISQEHRQFLAAGGDGFILGDGALNYAHEFITEWYYSAHLFDHTSLSFDYQFVKNPAYNRDRGPVHVFGLRFHAEW